MSKAPSMPMYWDAYIADTTHLTTEEHGAYLLLLAAMWRRNGSVPDSDKDIARIVGLTPAKWRRTKARLADFLIIENDEITQKNLQKIWKNTQEKIAKNRANGAKGGRPVSSKNKDLAKPNGSVSVNPNKSIPEPEPEPEKKEPSNEGSQKPRRKSRLPDDWRLPADWGEWAIGKGMDELSVRREAEQFANHHHGKGSLMLDWRRAWQTWVNNSLNWKSERQSAREARNGPEPGDRRTLPDGRNQYYANHYDGWMNEIC